MESKLRTVEYGELIKSLKTCQSNRFGCVYCAGCPMSHKCLDNIDCINELHKDSAYAIETLTRQVHTLQRELRRT